MEFTFETSGVCAKTIDIKLNGTIIEDVVFHGGCSGNGKSLSALLVGMEKDEAIKRLKNITCGHRDTSCGDQFAIALNNLNKM